VLLFDLHSVCYTYFAKWDHIFYIYPKSHNFAKFHTICIKTAKEIKLQKTKSVPNAAQGLSKNSFDFVQKTGLYIISNLTSQVNVR